MQVALLAWTGTTFAADKVFVTNQGADTISVFDAATLKVLTSVGVSKMPHNVQVSPNGRLAWVTNNGKPALTSDVLAHKALAKDDHESMANPGALWAIDTATYAIVAKVPVGMHPAHVVVSPDGPLAYVTNGGGDTVSVIDTAARRLAATIPVGKFPHGLRISPDGRQAYVANLKGSTVSVIDTASQKEVLQVPAGKGPAQVGFTPDGRLAFVSLSEESAVAVIDPATRKVTRKVALGSVPIQLYSTPDSRTLLVANQGTCKKPGRTVSVIDLERFKVAMTVVTGAGAHRVVVDREGRYAYGTNTCANSVSRVDLKDNKVAKTVSAGKAPNGISVRP